MPPDWHLSVWITDFVGHHPNFDDVMAVIASNYFASRLVAVVLICLWFGTRDSVRREFTQKAIIWIGVGVLLGFGVAESLCLIQDHVGDFWARPYDNHPEAQKAMELLYFRLPDSSFPSNAMCGFAPIATGLWFVDRRVSIAVWGLLGLWALGRVYVGIHYPLDIAGGIMIGVTCALVARKVMAAFDPVVSMLLRVTRKLYLA